MTPARPAGRGGPRRHGHRGPGLGDERAHRTARRPRRLRRHASSRSPSNPGCTADGPAARSWCSRRCRWTSLAPASRSSGTARRSARSRPARPSHRSHRRPPSSSSGSASCAPRSSSRATTCPGAPGCPCCSTRTAARTRSGCGRPARDYLASQWLADQGFCVVVADGRGTPNRGPAWERAGAERLREHARRPGRGAVARGREVPRRHRPRPGGHPRLVVRRLPGGTGRAATTRRLPRGGRRRAR